MLYGIRLHFIANVNYLQQSGKLEFALLQLTLQVRDLINSVQLLFQGKLLMNLINPTNLQNILGTVCIYQRDMN